jgi:hypothetical protein
MSFLQENTFAVSGVIAVIFLVVKFFEMRFVTKEDVPVKFLVRDSLFVLFSSLVGLFLLDQLRPLIKKTLNVGGGDSSGGEAPPVFVGEPNF